MFNGAVLRDVQHFVARVRIRVIRSRVVVHDFLEDYVSSRKTTHIAPFLEPRKQSIVVRNVVSEFTTTALNVSRNDVADRAIDKCHNNLRLGYQKRPLRLSICSANSERLSCALVAVFTPGVELRTLTAAARAAFAALLAASRFAASA